jgi:hypothetical protein
MTAKGIAAPAGDRRAVIVSGMLQTNRPTIPRVPAARAVPPVARASSFVLASSVVVVLAVRGRGRAATVLQAAG